MEVNLESKENIKQSEIITGIFAVLFYFISFTIPYIVSSQKGKIGLSKPNGNKNFLVSTALMHSEEYHQFITLSFFTFIIIAYYFIAFKGFFLNNNDVRVGLPISLYFFGVFIILLLWYSPNKSMNKHRTFAFLIFLIGQIIVTLLYSSYKDYYEEDNRFKSLETTFALSWVVFFVLIILGIVMNFINTKNCHIVNAVSSLEIIHIILVGISSIIFISLPALPSRCIFPRKEQEINKEIIN